MYKRRHQQNQCTMVLLHSNLTLVVQGAHVCLPWQCSQGEPCQGNPALAGASCQGPRVGHGDASCWHGDASCLPSTGRVAHLGGWSRGPVELVVAVERVPQPRLPGALHKAQMRLWLTRPAHTHTSTHPSMWSRTSSWLSSYPTAITIQAYEHSVEACTEIPSHCAHHCASAWCSMVKIWASSSFSSSFLAPPSVPLPSSASKTSSA